MEPEALASTSGREASGEPRRFKASKGVSYLATPSNALLAVDTKPRPQSNGPVKRFIRQQVPTEILEDPLLKAAMAVLPKNYNLEIPKTVSDKLRIALVCFHLFISWGMRVGVKQFSDGPLCKLLVSIFIMAIHDCSDNLELPSKALFGEGRRLVPWTSSEVSPRQGKRLRSAIPRWYLETDFETGHIKPSEKMFYESCHVKM
jgi:hypothetical protein